MLDFKIVYCCNTCNKDLVILSDFNNLTELGRIEIPIDQIRCGNCEIDNRCIVLVGPDQPEYKMTTAGITLLSGAMVDGLPRLLHPRIRLIEKEE